MCCEKRTIVSDLSFLEHDNLHHLNYVTMFTIRLIVTIIDY